MSTRPAVLAGRLLVLLTLSLSALEAHAQSPAPSQTFTFVARGVGPDFPVTLHRATGRWLASEMWLGRHHYRLASPEYQRLCVDHCVIPLLSPSYRFALTLGPNPNR